MKKILLIESFTKELFLKVGTMPPKKSKVNSQTKNILAKYQTTSKPSSKPVTNTKPNEEITVIKKKPERKITEGLIFSRLNNCMRQTRLILAVMQNIPLPVEIILKIREYLGLTKIPFYWNYFDLKVHAITTMRHLSIIPINFSKKFCDTSVLARYIFTRYFQEGIFAYKKAIIKIKNQLGVRIAQNIVNVTMEHAYITAARAHINAKNILTEIFSLGQMIIIKFGAANHLKPYIEKEYKTMYPTLSNNSISELTNKILIDYTLD